MGSIFSKLGGRARGPRHFAAVDFDGRQLRVVYAERSGRSARVLKASSTSIPEQLDPSDPCQLGELLGKVLKDMRLGGVGLLMNVTRGEAVLKPVTLPPGTSREEVAGMVSFQVGKELPFRPEEAVIDFTIESHYDADSAASGPETDEGIDVLVSAIRLPVVDHYRRIAQAAGAKLLRLGLRPYANVRCVNACRNAGFDDNVLLLNFGAEETEIDLLIGGSLMFSRSAAVKIPPADAEPEVRSQSVRSLVMEVRRSVQSYLAVERSLKIDKILVAGGTGLEAQAGRELSAAMKSPCHLLDVSMLANLADRTDASAFISAMGLAIAHGGSDRLPFDFLHPKRPAAPSRRKRTVAIAAAVVAVAVLVGGISVAAMHVSFARADAMRVKAMLDKEKGLEKSLLGAERQIRELNEWQDERRDWLSHWARLSAVFPGAEDAYITGLKSAETSGKWSLSFVVKARDSKIITDLSDRLAETGYKFQPGGVTTTSDPFGYSYSAEIRVFVEPDMVMDLASATPVPRPADDDSIRQLARSRSARSTPSGSGGSSENDRSRSPSEKPTPSRRPGDLRLDDRQMEKAQRKLVKEIVSRYDRNDDGKLTGSEMRSVFKYMRNGKNMKVFDTNRNGRLDRDEYARFRELLTGGSR